MSSRQQIDANQHNGKLSKGPKTVEGKIVSSKNSLKRGLLSNQPLLPGESPEAFAELAEGFLENYKPLGAVEAFLVERIIELAWRLRRARKIEIEIVVAQNKSIAPRRATAYGNQDRDQFFEDRATIASALSEDPQSRAVFERFHEASPEELEEVWSKMQDHMKADPLLAAALQREAERSPGPPTYGEAFLADSRHENALARLSRHETSIERSFYKALHELERMQAARQGKEVTLPVAVDMNVSGLEPALS